MKIVAFQENRDSSRKIVIFLGITNFREKTRFPAKNHQKRRLFDELRRFRRSHELRAEISLLTQSRSLISIIFVKFSSIMVMNDVSARRRCCAEAQARGVRGAAAPPGKWLIHRTPHIRTKRPVHYGSLPWSKSRSSPFNGDINAFTPSARRYALWRFSPYVLFIHSYREMPAGHAAETTTTTRWCCPWVPCHPSRPGSFH